MNNRGFTLIELIIIIIVLGILAVSAIPIYYNLADDAKTSAEKGVVGNVKAGIMLYYVNQAKSGGTPSYPSELDSEQAGTAASDSTPLFVNVIQGGVTESWTKTTDTTYTGPTGTVYTYNSATGAFSK